MSRFWAMRIQSSLRCGTLQDGPKSVNTVIGNSEWVWNQYMGRFSYPINAGQFQKKEKAIKWARMGYSDSLRKSCFTGGKDSVQVKKPGKQFDKWTLPLTPAEKAKFDDR